MRSARMVFHPIHLIATAFMLTAGLSVGVMILNLAWGWDNGWLAMLACLAVPLVVFVTVVLMIRLPLWIPRGVSGLVFGWLVVGHVVPGIHWLGKWVYSFALGVPLAIVCIATLGLILSVFFGTEERRVWLDPPPAPGTSGVAESVGCLAQLVGGIFLGGPLANAFGPVGSALGSLFDGGGEEVDVSTYYANVDRRVRRFLYAVCAGLFVAMVLLRLPSLVQLENGYSAAVYILLGATIVGAFLATGPVPCFDFEGKLFPCDEVKVNGGYVFWVWLFLVFPFFVVLSPEWWLYLIAA